VILAIAPGALVTYSDEVARMFARRLTVMSFLYLACGSLLGCSGDTAESTVTDSGVTAEGQTGGAMTVLPDVGVGGAQIGSGGDGGAGGAGGQGGVVGAAGAGSVGMGGAEVVVLSEAGTDGSVASDAQPDVAVDANTQGSSDADIEVREEPAPSVCGNGVREGTEQCDDGNTTNLDACSESCKFEQSQRTKWMRWQFQTDYFCAANAFGAAIGSLLQGEVAADQDASLADGTSNNLFHMVGMRTPHGQNDSFQLGLLSGTPAPGAGYDGTKDRDGWYSPKASDIGANRLPLRLQAATSSISVIQTGPRAVPLDVSLLGRKATLGLVDAKVMLVFGSESKPLTSLGASPGHLPAEHLDPALVTFDYTGLPNDVGADRLCGRIPAAELAKIPCPARLQAICAEQYGAANTLLDVFLGGCTYLAQAAIAPTPPDSLSSTAPKPGAGAPYLIGANAQRNVTSCRDKNNAVVDLAACLNAVTYSSNVLFTTDRVIIK